MGGCKTLPTLNFVHAETCKLGERVFTNPRRPLQRHNEVKLRHWVNHILPRCWIWWEHDGLPVSTLFYATVVVVSFERFWSFTKEGKKQKKRPERLLWIGLTRFKQQAATTTFEINVYATLREIAEVIACKAGVFWSDPWIVFRNDVVPPSWTLILPESWDESKSVFKGEVDFSLLFKMAATINVPPSFR